MTHVVLDSLTKTYAGGDEAAVKSLSLDIPNGTIAALLGPSGCGKSTTLKMIAGLLAPSGGAIYFDGKDVCGIPTEKRNAVMVFQNPLFFPHMNIEENIGFGLRMKGVNRATRRQRVQQMLEMVQLPGMGRRKPSQLSGGQQQRIALARALITEPHVLLLDEPLSNLDVHLRDEMRELIRQVQRQTNVTTVLVTHDQQEAVLMADHIALMFDGELQQHGTPADFYRYPHTEAIARFFGGVNFLRGQAEAGAVQTSLGVFKTPANALQTGDVIMTIRPEQIRIEPPQPDNSVQAVVENVIYGGTTTRYKVRVGDEKLEVLRSADLPGTIERGAEIWLYFPPERVWLLPAT